MSKRKPIMLRLSYALSKKLPEAEKTLQEAAAEPDADRPVRQNLALVLALEGKFASAEEVARRDLDPKDASANVAAIRRMIAQSNTWKQIQRSTPSWARAPRRMSGAISTKQCWLQVDELMTSTLIKHFRGRFGLHVQLAFLAGALGRPFFSLS
jgi:hypothetical protein